jgi:hypothetical protein
MNKTPSDYVSDEYQCSEHGDGLLAYAHECGYVVRLAIYSQDAHVDGVDREYARVRARDIHADVHEF